MTRKLLIPFLVLALAAMACNLQSVTPTPTVTVAPPSTDTPLPPTPTVTSAPTNTFAPVATIAGGLTLDMLKNGTYHTPVYGLTAKLVNGSYTEGSGAAAISVQMLGIYAYGDLNGDGKADAAIILAENGGGSGEFESVIAVLNQAGTPHQAGATQLGDRVLINSIDISSGVIHLNMVVQGPGDPLCCPSLPEKQNYWLIGNKLWLMRLNSTIGGVEHVINVNAPGLWTTVSNPFIVNGSVTVLPFENTLAYRVYKLDGTKVNESSLTVTPSGGTAGTFSQDFNLSSAGITDWVILQFVDSSAADGSTIALGSVILKVH